MNFKAIFCNHEYEIDGEPYPYPHGIDNPFTTYNTGWNRAWRIPLKCKKCGLEHFVHRSAPKLLSRKVTFYLSASASKYDIAKAFTRKLMALSEEQLDELFCQTTEIPLTCEVCGFQTIDHEKYSNHIWDEHITILQSDVLKTYFQSFVRK